MNIKRQLTPVALLTLMVMPVAATQQDEPRKALHALFDAAWAFELRENPLFATSVGEHAYDDRLPAVSEADEARRATQRREFLDRLKIIDRARLDPTDRVSYDLFEQKLTDEVMDFSYRGYLIPITVDSGFHIELAQFPRQLLFATSRDYENYIARLRAFPSYAGQHIELMRQGLRTGMTLPRVVLQGYEVTISAHVVDDPEKSVFYGPFQSFPTTLREPDRDRLRRTGRDAVLQAVAGYRTFLRFMTEEYMPNARTTLGASELPNGRDYYGHLVKRFTTLAITAEEVHRIGRAEVARIREEMDEVMGKSGFKGSFPEFLAFLRTDPRFYARTPDELLKEAAYIAKRMDGKLPSLFGRLPRLPYGIQPVPAHLAPKYTGGRYIEPPLGSTEPGYYWVNTYALESRPLYVLEALTLHEAVPGHHLQIALSRELEDLPQFRRFSYHSAFGEGWGLYSERLGLEAGFYTDSYRNFGRLTYEMWRACRLVVDTGIHAMGWSREQAMDYLASNTALSLHEVKTETDRYISWPGQALAYKMGELKIRELRRKAELALGERFDVRQFHDAVLGSGSVTLPILESQVDAFIGDRLAGR